MHSLRRSGFLAAAAVLAVSAATAQELRSDYTPPDRAPEGSVMRTLQMTPDAAIQAIWADLEAKNFTIETIDPEQRLVVARYSGDPRPFVDCGTVRVIDKLNPAAPPKQKYSANRPETRVQKITRNRQVGLLRKMQLDARLVVRVEPKGKEDSRVTSEAQYVLSLAAHRLRKGGGYDDEVLRRETISFTSDRAGQFDSGGTCVANGKLERMPTATLKNEPADGATAEPASVTTP
ncbi:MAG: hypothetical protein U1E45_22010 [Geminicoccaceae bacterium]